MVEVVQNWGKGLPQDTTHYFGQTLSINECAYRNLYRVKYLVYTDLDEFIVPKKSLGWEEMMKDIESVRDGTYLFRHAYFFENFNKTSANWTSFACSGSQNVKLPSFLTRVTRSREIHPPEIKSKYIIKPTYALAVGVHEVFKHVEYHVRTYVVPPEYALLHHCRTFKGGRPPRYQRVPDARALVFKTKIVAGLKRQLCFNN